MIVNSKATQYPPVKNKKEKPEIEMNGQVTRILKTTLIYLLVKKAKGQGQNQKWDLWGQKQTKMQDLAH